MLVFFFFFLNFNYQVCIVKLLHIELGRKRRFEFIDVGECSLQVESNEDQAVQETPLAEDDRRHSLRSDDETQPPSTFILYDLIV